MFVRVFLACNGRFLVIMDSTQAHGSAVANILIDPFDTKDFFKLAIRNVGRAALIIAIIELAIFREEESKGIRTGQNDLHAHGCIYVRKQRRTFNIIGHQGYFIDEHILVAFALQIFQVLDDISKRILCRDLDERSLLRSASDISARFWRIRVVLPVLRRPKRMSTI